MQLIALTAFVGLFVWVCDSPGWRPGWSVKLFFLIDPLILIGTWLACAFGTDDLVGLAGHDPGHGSARPGFLRLAVPVGHAARSGRPVLPAVLAESKTP